MSDEVATDDIKVVVLQGATHLSEEELDSEIKLADATLKSRGYPRGVPVHWQPRSDLPPSPFVAALVDVEGVPTMFLGLALETIQAMHNAEK